MKTVEEVIAFLESEKQRLESHGTYSEDVAYLDFLIAKIKGESE